MTKSACTGQLIVFCCWSTGCEHEGVLYQFKDDIYIGNCTRKRCIKGSWQETPVPAVGEYPLTAELHQTHTSSLETSQIQSPSYLEKCFPPINIYFSS